jgi:hypothetical protein
MAAPSITIESRTPVPTALVETSEMGKPVLLVRKSTRKNWAKWTEDISIPGLCPQRDKSEAQSGQNRDALPDNTALAARFLWGVPVTQQEAAD